MPLAAAADEGGGTRHVVNTLFSELRSGLDAWESVG